MDDHVRTASYRRPIGVFVIQMIAAWCLCLTAYSKVPDLTAGGTPTTTKKINLGPTGARGWFYHVSENSSESRQILVQNVDAGSPAAGVLAPGDVILGANGSGANPSAFSSDARKTLGNAIAAAEARKPATLKLLR